MAAEPGEDETFWRWSIIVAGAVIIASVSAILFVGKASSQDTAASATSTTLANGLHVVPGSATPTTEPTVTVPKVKIKPTTTPTVKPAKVKAKPSSALPTVAQLPFTPTATPTSPTTPDTAPDTTPVTTPDTTPPDTTPPNTTPPVTTPPVTTPPVTIPPVTIPPVTIPPVTIPTVSVP